MPDLGKVPFVLCRLSALLLCLLVAPPALTQSEGDVMQIYQRTEKQVEKLHQTVPVAIKQAVAATVAINEFRSSKTREDIKAAVEKGLEALWRNERSLENLSLVLHELGESMPGLGQIAESAEGAARLESLKNLVAVSQEQLSVLASDTNTHELFRAQLNMVQGAVRAQQQEDLRKKADEHRDQAKNAKTDLEETGKILLSLSAEVEIFKMQNDLNRELLVSQAMHKMPTNEARESLERVMGQFGTAKELGVRVATLGSSLGEATAEMIESLWDAGATGLPDFSQADIEAYYEWEERPVEISCEECTDGLDNDLNGKTDAEQSKMCEVFVRRDPTCTMSNRY